MALKINEYPNEAQTLGKTDWFDIDKDVDGLGTTYQTNKLSWAVIKGQFSLMTQIDISASATGTTLQSIFGSILGTLTVPKNRFQVGDTFHLNMCGLIRSANNETIEIHLESSTGAILATSGTITLPTITNKVWELEADFVIRAIGASTVAQICTIAEFTYNKDSNDRFEGKHFYSLNSTTFDTTVDNTLDVKVVWGSNNATNRINTQIAYLNKTY